MASAALLLPLVSAGPSATAEQRSTGSLQRDFAAAAARYGVPQSVLLGVSYLQSRWDAHGGAASVTGGYGPMHLTDARTALAEAPHHSHGIEDARGDDARPARNTAEAELPEPSELPERLRTLDRAAELSGYTAEQLRDNPAANVHGGAALLAGAQQGLGRPLSEDPADWYGAVARFSGADDTATATTYANDVFDVIRTGESRITDSGQQVALAGDPAVAPDPAQAAPLGLRTADAGKTECPRTVACEWIPAPYEEFGEGDYGNHDLAARPASQSVKYIIIHDTEGSWDTTLKLVQDPTYVSWQYTLRSSDGHIAQHVPLKDVAWHAGNWYVNAKSVGLEHEGFLASPDAWYTEAMYRTSARLVRYLAQRYDIPLDRQHILGHDNVPGTTAATIRGMHTDPGPYWDWAHYFQLIGKPFTPTAGPGSGVVTIRPDYGQNQPVYTGCVKPGQACVPHGSAAVRLYTAPAEDAPWSRTSGCVRAATPRPVSTIPVRVPRPASSMRSPGARGIGRRSGTWGRRRGSTTRARSRRRWAPGAWCSLRRTALRRSRCTDGPTRRRRRTPPASRCRRSRRCRTSCSPARGTWSATGRRASTCTRRRSTRLDTGWCAARSRTTRSSSGTGSPL